MKKHISILALAALASTMPSMAQRSETYLKDGWQFSKGSLGDVKEWQSVTVPHDWAIYGPFDRANDLQTVAVEQNGETEATVKTGRTGGLPFIGKGVYRTTFEVPDTAGRSLTLLFDGVMSNAEVTVNGHKIAAWPYGYNSFYVSLDGVARPGGNDLIVECENKEGQSRWYPGAGIYRNVRLIDADKLHIPVWGTYVTTPVINKDYASVNLKLNIAGGKSLGEQWPYGQYVGVTTEIISPEGKVVARDSSTYVPRGQEFAQNFIVKDPQLWSVKTPSLYTARTTLSVDGRVADVYDTRFGIRKIEYIPSKGFFLNGEYTKFRGVNNHHDLGPLGAAVNKAALRHQIEMLQDMGVNAIRTSHNMPAPELVELCDEMGIMLMIEPFDDWGFRPKSPNGYGSVFNEWAERDITNMVEQYRNHPSVVMWSIGNEVPSQWGPVGMEELQMLQGLVHKLDPTRPVTCGMDQIDAVLDNGYAAALDIPSFNYKPQRYDEIYSRLPQQLLLGSETASTVSSRGVYHFPVGIPDANARFLAEHPDNQSSSYDVETCAWSNIPDIDFARDDDNEWVMGQFVWTGFDYLGEPSPYDTDAWPSHSSYFGIIDLASLPKDRYYLYRSQWNKDDATLHMLPHWNWAGREGETTPVYVYTSYPRAELFVNGVSQGVREKDPSSLMTRYRLMWDDVVYQPGELKVVAYDAAGAPAAEQIVKTAGKPYRLVATPNRQQLRADGEDLVYITVQAVDKDGNVVPTADNEVKFSVKGAGSFRAAANGDPTSLRQFHLPVMDLFSGAATAIVQASGTPGEITFTATSKGLKPATVTIQTVK